MKFLKLLPLALMLLQFSGCTKTNSDDEYNSTQTKQTNKKKKKPISPSTETNTTNETNTTSEANTTTETNATKNQPPLFTKSSTVYLFDGNSAFTLPFSDPEGDKLSYTLSGTDASGLTVDSSGVVRFSSVPDRAIQSKYFISAEANDSIASTKVDLTITILPTPQDINTTLDANVSSLTLNWQQASNLTTTTIPELTAIVLNQAPYSFTSIQTNILNYQILHEHNNSENINLNVSTGYSKQIIHLIISSKLYWKAIAVGKNFSVALRSDGTLWSWGSNGGRLGTNSIPSKFVPTQIGRDSNWTSISVGLDHTLALKRNGTLWAWGINFDWQLGDGTRTTRTTPTQIGTDSDWKKVSAGYSYSFALKNNGTLWGWGTGSLGEGTTDGSSSPIQIGDETKWELIEVGDNHTLAIKNDGTLWSWGRNNSNKLGYTTYFNYNDTPKQVGSSTNWKDIAVNYNESFALKTDGTLWAWGNNNSGQLGDGTTTNRLTPTQIGADTDWQTISAGESRIFAIKNNGTLWASGKNKNGELGNGTTTDYLTMTQIGHLANWKAITAGSYHTLALKRDGSLWTWGNNYTGQLGDGTVTSSNVPIQTKSYPSHYQHFTAGGNHNIAIQNDGSLWAWGDNYTGQLGNGKTSTSSIAPTKIGNSFEWHFITAGYYHSIAIKKDGTLWVWGS